MIKAYDRLQNAGKEFKDVFEEACISYDKTDVIHQVVQVEVYDYIKLGPDRSREDSPVLQTTFHTTRSEDALDAAIKWLQRLDFIGQSYGCRITTEVLDDGCIKCYSLCQVDLSIKDTDTARRVGYPVIADN